MIGTEAVLAAIFIRLPGERRDPLFRRLSGSGVDPGFRREAG
jgi:hypothetical protein